VVTLPTDSLPGRITYALYKKMDWMDCVAKDVDDYVRIALLLGTDRNYREAARSELKARGEAIYEDAEVVRELERFLRETVSVAK
jgi:predicted O-linked N-acetylglucosamine transferase (SPINDLY family)